jgi:hypothetical protein
MGANSLEAGPQRPQRCHCRPLGDGCPELGLVDSVNGVHETGGFVLRIVKEVVGERLSMLAVVVGDNCSHSEPW